MKETRLGTILENACRLAGREPGHVGVPTGWKVLAAMAIAEGLRRLAAEKFPMLMRVEFRRYRPDWKEGIAYARGHEVWHGTRYWRMCDVASQGEPGVADGWHELDMKEMAAFIAWEQPWENTVIDSGGVDIQRFAYRDDPKYHPDAAPVRVTGMNEMGIVLESPAPEGVWCRFAPEFPDVSFAEWSEETGYEIGDVVYRTATKDVYIRVGDEAEEGTAPEESADWQVFRVRHEFAPFLTRLAAVDMLTEDQGKHQTRSTAEVEFEALCERYHEGNGERMVRRGRFR